MLRTGWAQLKVAVRSAAFRPLQAAMARKFRNCHGFELANGEAA
jgi:hypothetical protein